MDTSQERADRKQLSGRRRAVLDAVQAADAPLGVTEVADRLDVHPNTVRFHLDALVAQGRVERTVEQPSGPGCPRTVYAPQPGMDRGGTRRYRLLARMLLSQLASTGSGADAAATDAGRAWGRYLVEHVPPSRRLTADEAVGRLAAMLDDLGFDPQIGGDGEMPGPVRLRHCPFLELAEEYGTIVCPLHLGLMQGALAELRAPVEATRLEPFAEPDVCLAHLASSTAA
ncbi:helix-turn-helix transcriptional regulator [Streptomyces afghaniensis]|uniref:helix-turn-helix transcriptional regulator n=1 Tax=Streptomyces afghaniensis TaxID=66865 RepID=UPI002787C6FF|nr:helix-turn-helix domain-containing protein [Streptomyces afghaniensis]MDQ1014338.1 putative ArsR family transcriptional regulator [Streptomyces afghaniensis]